MIMAADEAIRWVAEHAFSQGADLESTQLRERREAAEEVIKLAFAVWAEVETCLEPATGIWKLQPASAWARNVLQKATATIGANSNESL